ncbi:MAG: radical SAM protein [Desulfatitalea sp.]|nr:radical SAM protein [Desulfatitalea sp.]NNK00269.1 radical SAM protein [Desulfatitalea sp.]
MFTPSAVFRYVGQFARNRMPGQVVIQITNRCNALCPQCGMRRGADIHRSDLPDEEIRRTLDACAAQGVQAVSFTGGEPLLMLDRLIGWINHAGRAGIPFIRTGTNGFLLRGAEHPGFEDRIKGLAERLAATPLRNFWISIDSCVPQVHEQMRGLKGVVAGIEKALPIFHAAGLYPSANLGVNRMVGGKATTGLHPDGFKFKTRTAYLQAFLRAYTVSLDRFFRLVGDLGFTTVNTCYPMSIDESERQAGLNAVYAATTTERVVRFAADEKAMLYKALLDTIPNHRRRLRIFSPLSAIYMLHRAYTDEGKADLSHGCRGGVDFFFIDAVKGNVFPCGYRGNENMGKFWDLRLKSLRPDNRCRRCDWECFRDPSELCAPFLQVLFAPATLARKMTGNPVFRRLWLEDLRYYRLCDFFDGRRPPALEKPGRMSMRRPS